MDRAIVRLLPAGPRRVVQRLSAPYIAGATLDDARRTVAGLNAEGKLATIDVLGEEVTRPAEAEAVASSYHAVLDAIAGDHLDANVSVKLTALGLKVELDLCRSLLATVVADAAARGIFVRIDMEDSSCTDPTLAIYAELRKQLANVGVVLQARLKRSVEDARRLASVRANVRVCKGIYIEPASIALTDREAVRDSFMEALRLLAEGGSYVGIATHDEQLIERSRALVQRLGLGPQAYEFQMLYGVTTAMGRRLVAEGHRLRVYVPFGSHWYAYSLRRLRENPEIAGYVLKSLIR